jgi:hypothetical protein
MFNLQALTTRALLALALTLGAGAAFAGPTYHVAIDTKALTATSGFFDLEFNSPGTAELATATLFNFAGNFRGLPQADGGASGDLGNSVVIDNSSSFNAFLQPATFGGLFSFDVRFDVAASGDGSTFGVALFDEGFAYLGADGYVVQINLVPGEADVVAAVGGVATVSAVPEPADWLLMATGLALLGVTVRRRGAR